MTRKTICPLNVAMCVAVALGRSGVGRGCGESGAEEERGAKFIRFVDDNEGGGKLQTAIVTYKNVAGVKVDLVGAVHVGDPGVLPGAVEDVQDV